MQRKKPRQTERLWGKGDPEKKKKKKTAIKWARREKKKNKHKRREKKEEWMGEPAPTLFLGGKAVMKERKNRESL